MTTTRVQSRVLPDELVAVVLSFLPVDVLCRADMMAAFVAFYNIPVVKTAVKNGRWLGYEQGLFTPNTLFKGCGVSSLAVDPTTNVLLSGHSSSILHWRIKEDGKLPACTVSFDIQSNQKLVPEDCSTRWKNHFH